MWGKEGMRGLRSLGRMEDNQNSGQLGINESSLSELYKRKMTRYVLTRREAVRNIYLFTKWPNSAVVSLGSARRGWKNNNVHIFPSWQGAGRQVSEEEYYVARARTLIAGRDLKRCLLVVISGNQRDASRHFYLCRNLFKFLAWKYLTFHFPSSSWKSLILVHYSLENVTQNAKQE